MLPAGGVSSMKCMVHRLLPRACAIKNVLFVFVCLVPEHTHPPRPVSSICCFVTRRVLLGAPEAFRVVLQQVVSSAHAGEGGSNSAGGPEKLVAGLLTDLVSAFVGRTFLVSGGKREATVIRSQSRTGFG